MKMLEFMVPFLLFLGTYVMAGGAFGFIFTRFIRSEQRLELPLGTRLITYAAGSIITITTLYLFMPVIIASTRMSRNEYFVIGIALAIIGVVAYITHFILYFKHHQFIKLGVTGLYLTILALFYFWLMMVFTKFV